MNDVLAPTHSEVQLGDAARAILEARAEPRVGVDFPVQVFSGDFSGPLPARARDISVDGLCLATPSMLSFKAIRRLRLDLASGSVRRETIGEHWDSLDTAGKRELLIRLGVRVYFSRPPRSPAETATVTIEGGALIAQMAALGV